MLASTTQNDLPRTSAQRKYRSCTVRSPRRIRTERVVPTPNGRGDVQVTRETARHQDKVSSLVKSAHTRSAGRGTSMVSTYRVGAVSKKPSSQGCSLDAIGSADHTRCRLGAADVGSRDEQRLDGQVHGPGAHRGR